MRNRRDVSHMIGHPYFKDSEGRDDAGTGLETAMAEMAAAKAKTERLRAARRGESATKAEDVSR